MRGADLDKLYVVDTWLRQNHLVTVPSTVDFAPGIGLTPQSQEIIREGLDVDLSRLTATIPQQKQFQGSQPLVQHYAQQLGAGDSWLQGSCVPFSNPYQSHLHRVATMTSQGTRYTVYHGGVHNARGGFQLFPNAEVWIGVRADGRLGFELLEQQPAKNGNPAITSVATLFTYPSTHLGTDFVQQPVGQREQFYDGTYTRVLATMVNFEQATPLQIKG